MVQCLGYRTVTDYRPSLVDLSVAMARWKHREHNCGGGNTLARAITAQPLLTLDRYRFLLNLPMYAFNGIENPDEARQGCDNIWPQATREMLASVLREAEQTLAANLGFTLGLEYQVDYDRPYTNPIVLNWGHIVGPGVRARTEVTSSDDDFTIDPATITVAQADFPGGTSEIVIVEDDTGLEITPDGVASDGTDYIISINQCKLINWANLENQADPIDYDDTFPVATWLKLADLTIYREYRDESDEAQVTYGPRCSCTLTDGSACASTSYAGCVYTVEREISKVTVQIAEYDADSEIWTGIAAILYGCYESDKVNVKYLAGTTDVPGYERVIMRLAHAYMLFEPCGCSIADHAWRRDSRVPPAGALTSERANCPYGVEDGAWYAWNWMMRNQQGEAFLG